MKSPFKFLDPYELKDKNAFFGRDAEIKELYNLVTKNRLTFVYGPSGTGKTSLVQCGLAGRFGGADWLPLFIRRGEDLNQSLKRELGRALGQKTPYEGDPTEAIIALFNRYLRPVYLIFDQFEELFILGDRDEEQERIPFYETIAGILENESPCRLLFIMREDYFGYLNEFEKMVPDLYHRKLRVEPMNRDNLRQVVTGSCKVYGIDLGDDRRDPDRILDNLMAKRAAVQMPFVQVYLHMLFGEAVKQQKTKEGQAVRFDKPVIETLGPIEDALGLFLKEQEAAVLAELKQKGFKPADDVVRAVLDVFVSEEGTKIPILYHTGEGGLIQLKGKTAGQLHYLDPALISACLDALERSRILRRGEDDLEIAHDTLASQIYQQRSDEQRQILEIRRRVETGYREYIDSGGAYFFDSGQLARIDPFLDKMKATLEPEWLEFLDNSHVEVNIRENAERERVERELQLAREKLAVEERARRRQRRLTGWVAAAALAAVGLAVVAGVMGVRARDKTKLAEEQTKEAEKQKETAEKSLYDAWKEQFNRASLEKEIAARSVAAFEKVGETLNIVQKKAEVTRLDSLMEDLRGKIAEYEKKQ